MWRPGFDYLEARPAILRGAQRSLCVFSFVHRGTKYAPGLVFGLDRGGDCVGLAYRVAGEKRREVMSYLRHRERLSNVYTEALRPVEFLRDVKEPSAQIMPSGEVTRAVCYMVRRTHRQYAGHLTFPQKYNHVRRGSGQSGRCIDYVLNTAQHLRELNIIDPELKRMEHALSRNKLPQREFPLGPKRINHFIPPKWS